MGERGNGREAGQPSTDGRLVEMASHQEELSQSVADLSKKMAESLASALFQVIFKSSTKKNNIKFLLMKFLGRITEISLLAFLRREFWSTESILVVAW